MQTSTIRLCDVESSDVARPLTGGSVDALAASIGSIGLIQPITVRPIAKYRDGRSYTAHKIVAGHHRVAAARKLGWSEIEAFVLPDGATPLDAELIEIDENLCRAELTPAQRSVAIKRRKEIWEALHPGDKGGKTVATLGGPQRIGFAADTAKVSGMSKPSINQHLARAESLGDDLEEIAGTSLDKGVELDALAKMPEPERRELIDKAKAGEQVTARKKEHDDGHHTRLAKQAVQALELCAKYMDADEFAVAMKGITVSAAAARMAQAIGGASE